MMKMLAGAAGLATFAAAPAAAQYYQPYGYGAPSQYGYGNNYAYGMNTNAAAQQCSAAVQSRLANRTSLGGIIGSLVGIPTGTYGRVLSITSANPNRYGGVRVRGLASSGRMASNGYGPYGVGAYGALGYNGYGAADLSFRCEVDHNGYVRDVDINRRY